MPALAGPDGAGVASVSGAGAGVTAAFGSRETVKTASRPVSSSAWRSKLMPVALTWTRAVTESVPSGSSALRSTFSIEAPRASSKYLPEPSRSTDARPATSMCRWLIGATASV